MFPKRFFQLVFIFEGIHQEGLQIGMEKKRAKLEQMWIAGEFDGSEEELNDLVNSDERIKNLVFKDRKACSVTFDQRWRTETGVAKIANGYKFCSSVDELSV